MKNIIIAIDGVCGSGKSTIGQRLAEKLNFEYINSGNLYRIITYLYINDNTIINDIETFFKYFDAPNTQIGHPNGFKYNGEFYNSELRTEFVEENLYLISNNLKIRNFVNQIIIKFCYCKNVIIEGRDIGTVVFPNATFKFFLFKNRLQKVLEGKLKSTINFQLKLNEEEKKTITKRDLFDIERENSPLRIAKNAKIFFSFEYQLDSLLLQIYSFVVNDLFPICFCGESFLNFRYSGILSQKVEKKPHILLVSSPTFENVTKITDSPCIVFTGDVNPFSHETIMFKDFHIPYIHLPNTDVNSLINKELTFFSCNNLGFISTTPNHLLKESSEILKVAFTSNKKGMKYCSEKGASIVATRGEFIYFQSTKLNPQNASKDSYWETMNSIIMYGQDEFDFFIYRFTDFSDDFLCLFSPAIDDKFDNSSIGNRGSYRLLNNHLNFFNDQIELVIKRFLYKNNIMVLLPFVRSIHEAKQAVKIIKSKKFGGKIGCMIEVPALFYNSKELNELFDFFVLGVSDLLQLSQGSDRNVFRFENFTYLFIADLINTYLLPSIEKSKPIYITSKIVYNLVKHNNTNIELLSKL